MTRAAIIEDLRAVEALFGAILHHEPAAAALGQLAVDDFTRNPDRLIFEAMKALHRQGGAVDMVRVRAHLEAAGKMKAAGGTGRLLELSQASEVAANWKHYADIIAENAHRRRLKRASSELTVAIDKGVDIDPIIDKLTIVRTDRANRDASQIGTLMSEIQSERLSWLWPGRIPAGKLVVVDGDPGLGKTTLALDIAARISRGHAMPDGTGGGEPAGIVIMSAEDGPGDTIRPRLEAAGANLEKILFLADCPDDQGGHPPVLPDDLPWIEKAIERVAAELVIIDPLMAHLGGDTNAHRDQDVRRVLRRMADLAETTSAAIVVIRHLNKATGGNALYRGGGSIGIIGAARSGLLVARDPDDQGEESRGRVLATTKCNLAKEAGSLKFHLEEAEAKGITTSKIVWDGISQHAADALLAQADGEEKSALQEAAEFLDGLLTGGAVEASEVKRSAKSNGISERTLYKAKQSLDILSRREGFGRDMRSFWELPVSPKTPSFAHVDSKAKRAKLAKLGETGETKRQESTAPTIPQITPEADDLTDIEREGAMLV